jgi:hypothetical protein
LSLYATEADEIPLLRFIEASKNAPYYDYKYALRVCYDAGKKRACVGIFTTMRCYEEAVKLSLEFDSNLAKRVILTASSQPNNESNLLSNEFQSNNIEGFDLATQKKCWLMIAKAIIAENSSKNIKKSLDILNESGNMLSLVDILPFFPDFIRIGEFQDEICKNLENYNKTIENLKEEMENFAVSGNLLTNSLYSLQNRSGFVTNSRKCDLCFQYVFYSSFLLFPCMHVFHSKCLTKQWRIYLKRKANYKQKLLADKNTQELEKEKEKSEQVEEEKESIYDKHEGSKGFRSDHSHAIHRKPWSQMSADEREGKLIEDVINDECLFCGEIMIESVQTNFIFPAEKDEEQEIQSWQV